MWILSERRELVLEKKSANVCVRDALISAKCGELAMGSAGSLTIFRAQKM